MNPALLGHEIHVFQYDHGGLEVAGELAGRGDEPVAGARKDERRPSRHPPDEVHGRERLARAGRAVQQQTPLEMPARGQELLCVLRETHGVAFDPPEHPFRQDDLVVLDLRVRQELDHRPTLTIGIVRATEGE
jgi:hypothetical protein